MRTLVLAVVAAVLLGLGVVRQLPKGEPAATATARELGATLLEKLGVAKAGADASASARPVFREVASEIGLLFDHDNDLNGQYRLPEEMGPGAGFLDADGDGDLDVIVLGGGSIDGTGPAQRCRLFRNDGVLFSDVTESALPIVNGPAFGVGCADYDNDGDVDIYITRLGANVLLRNRGDGTFEDVTAESGVGDEGFGASLAFFDFDRDGWLDIFITNYVEWSLAKERECFAPFGVRDFCSPTVYDTPSADVLYRNRGDGTFENVTESAGIASARGNGLGVVASDFDGDGWPDVYVANDQTPGAFWKNNGDGTFTNIAVINGTALDGRGVAIAGMGVASEDMNDDGAFDLFVTNVHDQTHLLLENFGKVFVDASAQRGVGAWSVPLTGFGVAVFDQDNDGAFDCFIANGGVNLTVESASKSNPYGEPNQFLRFTNGKFIDATGLIGEREQRMSRAVAAGDADNDGDLDLLVTNCGGPLELLRNDAPAESSWLMIDARTGEGQRSAIGARITVTADGRDQVREVRPQQSYLASGDHRVHFGLGAAQRVERVRVLWPDGAVTELTDVAANQLLRVVKGDARE